VKVDAHDVIFLEREAVGRWVIGCSCLASIAGVDPIDAYHNHTDHVLAAYWAEETGVEPASA
jgi:hypothetical protein